MNIWQKKTSIVSKLRVKGRGFDAVATRLRFERLFGATNFLPAGLPAKAIICIKNLRDPAPRTLHLNRADLKYSDAWRNSLAKEIETLFRRAFRPIREIVPAQAESIFFADDSELLACLASDWCHGSLPEHWWWRSLFPDLQQAQTIARIWIEAAEFAPAALRILADQGKAVRFVTELQPDESKNLLRQIMLVFGLDKLRDALLEPFDKEREPDFSPAESSIEIQSASAEIYFFDALQSFAPWRELVPETRQAVLSFERQCLLGVGLMLVRAPRIVRTPEFARQAKIFRAEFEIKKTAARDESEIPERRRKTKNGTEKNEESSFPPEKSEVRKVSGESKVKTEKSAEKKASQEFKNSPVAIEKNVKSADSSSVSESEDSSPADETRKAASRFIFEDSRAENIPDRRKSGKETKSYGAGKETIEQLVFAETLKEFETEIVVETRFGGVFYLLNLGLYLNLYRDFSATAQSEIDLNIWDFVAFLGREFLGEEIEKDSVRKLLERLAGRENGEEIEHEFAPPDDWRTPPEWLETFRTSEKWLWKSDGERLIVRHPAGFNVVDVKLSGDAKSRLENELKNYGRKLSQIAESGGEEFFERFSASENWLKNLFEYVRRRLLQSLNLQTREQVNAILFERKATVAVAATNLDVTFSLADLPFEIRLSGLDRDPGWIPAAGKFVRFHFI